MPDVSYSVQAVVGAAPRLSIACAECLDKAVLRHVERRGCMGVMCASLDGKFQHSGGHSMLNAHTDI